MKKRTWKVIAVISFAAAVILTAVVLRIYTQREHARQTYEEMQQQNSEKRQTDTQESKEQSKTKEKKKKLDIPVDFETLQKENPDIYAWITIPGTDIDYPVVQDSTDNTYYLNHAADTSLSDSGAIYSEKKNAKDFDDYLTVLYGHNMKDGSMFAGLHKYEDKTFLKDHKDLTIYTPDSILKYRIFAAYLTDNRHVLPLVYEALAECRAAALADRVMFAKVREKSLRLMALQRTMTEEFLELYAHLQQMGVKPLAVKGIVCRSLYPNPDARLSADEDLLIPKEQFEACQEAMLLYGMQQLNPETGTENYETAYKKTGGFLVIELHRMLFPENEKWCIGWNGFFDEIHKQAIEREVEGVKINMPQPTDHLFFQFCHARKHLLASGVGIRQICDILLFAEYYEKEIDWEIFWDRIRMTDAILFAEAIFRLGVQYLGFEEKQFYFPEGVHSMKLDTERLMEDILHSGIHGKGTRSRLHSGTLTLHAAEKRGLSGIFPGLFYMAFPPAKNLLWRFPYLKKHPYLLPFAWGQRLCGYLREGPVLGSVKEIVKTGRKRKEILREYGIFGEKRR